MNSRLPKAFVSGNPSTARTYVVALILCTLFVPLGIYLETNYSSGFRLVLLAILFSSWYGGLGPGLLASAVTCVAALYLTYSGKDLLSASDFIYLMTFAILALLISILNGSLYEASRASQEYGAQRERFIAVISHEIRTPLNGVIGMTDLLERTSLSRLQKDYLATLKLSAQTLMNLVNNTLDFSKLRSKTVELVRKPFSLAEEVGEVLKRNEETARKAGLELVHWFSPNLPEKVLGDSVRLNQVLSNLLDNAIKFTEKGAVSVSVKPLKSSAKKVEIGIEVSDTGIGMSREFQSRVFDVFVQAASPSEGPQKGTGLGLAICNELVVLMGGTIEVESRPREGTTFRIVLAFELPTQADIELGRERETQSATSQWRVNEGASVLAVDDNEANLEVIKAMLQHLGISPTLVSNGESAVALAEAHPFDLILLDIYMPGMSGEEVFERVRKSRPQTQVFFLSADSSAFLKAKLLQGGAAGYLTKPITLEDLANCLIETGMASGDWRSLSPLKTDDRFRGLYAKYLKELPARLNQIQCFSESGTRQELAQSIHALKSVSLVLGVRTISDVCADFEKAVDPQTSRQSLDRLAVESVKTAIHLSRLVEQGA